MNTHDVPFTPILSKTKFLNFHGQQIDHIVLGWFGIPLIIVCGTVAAYNGMNLGRCWTILLELHPELRSGEERRPYPTIGQKAFGNWMRLSNGYIN